MFGQRIRCRIEKMTHGGWCLLVLGLLSIGGCGNVQTDQVDLTAPPPEPPWPLTHSSVVSEKAELGATGISIFDSKTLDGWEVTNFGGEGECYVENGELTIEMGYPLSGVTCIREDLPNNNYEISLEAKRTEGVDFFCGLTFPIKDSFCTLIVGGWGGAIVGLSCVDDLDAAQNETKQIMKFEDNRWYKIRVVVGDSVIVWIDNEVVVDLATKDRNFSLRAETVVTKPLGICSFESTAKFRNIAIKTHSKAQHPDSKVE